MENKILFTGPVGAGKTTSISSVSDIVVVATEAKASDEVAQIKKNTTVAMDYGTLNLEGGEKVHLYGTPGQDRFSFMWDILSKGAMGIVILIDNARPDPLADLEFYLKAFSQSITRCGNAVVVGVTRTEIGMQTDLDFTHTKLGKLSKHVDLLDRFNERLAALKLNIPVFEVDGRKREDVKQLLLALLALLDPSTSRA
jgi:signal recognition particle receptor subunit beta